MARISFVFRQSKATRFEVARIVLTLVLLTAAALKAYQVSTEPVDGLGPFSSRWVLILEVEFEIALGLWLAGGIRKDLSWLVALMCFTSFAAVTLYKALSGETTCGCFGKIAVNPWYTFAFDAAVVGFLCASQPQNNQRILARLGLRLAALGGLAVILGIPSGVAMASYSPAVIEADGTIKGGERWVVFEPGEWQG